METTTQGDTQAPTVTATACLVPQCTKDMRTSSHGLCRTHYKMALSLVKKDVTTWKELEDRGKSLPAKFTRDGRDRIAFDEFLNA